MVDEVNIEDEDKKDLIEDLDEESQIIDEVTEENKDNEKYELLQESFLRLQADFTNYKRRTEQEKQDYLNMGVSKVINDILPIVDNFERALENKEEGNFYEGVEMIYAQIEALLERNGVEEIKALNEKFDPNFHHAVLVEEAKDVESDTVIDVLQKGYKLGEKVLRPAMVKVSQ